MSSQRVGRPQLGLSTLSEASRWSRKGYHHPHPLLALALFIDTPYCAVLRIGRLVEAKLGLRIILVLVALLPAVDTCIHMYIMCTHNCAWKSSSCCNSNCIVSLYLSLPTSH